MAVVERFVQCVYATVQLYMIFKYSNVIVNRYKRLANIGFMHCIASDLCIWMYTIISETMDYHLNTAFDKINQTYSLANLNNSGKLFFDNDSKIDLGFEITIFFLIHFHITL